MTIKAVAVFTPDKPSIKVTGTITFIQEKENGPTEIDIKIEGLTPGEHGFHVQYVFIFKNVQSCNFCGLNFLP